MVVIARALLLALALLMADGINQTGVGALITAQNNAHADASLDGIAGSYSFNDIGLKALPSGDYIDNATFEKSYRSKVSIQNGDGVGSLATTFKDSLFSLFLDSGKTLSAHATGRANRTFEFGTKVVGVKDSGKDLWKIVSGAALTLQANLKLYGGTLRSTTGNVNLQPTGGLIGEIVNCLIQNGSGNITIGSTGASLQEVYNVDMILANTSGSVLGNLVADYCERITLALSGTLNLRFINTATAFSPRDVVFIGTPTTDIIKYTGPPGGKIIEPTYAPAVPVMTSAPTSDFGEWWRFEPRVASEISAAPLVATVLVYRRTGELLLTAISDSNGKLTYGSGVTAQCLEARYMPQGLTAWNEAWPLTVVVNGDNQQTAYLPRTFLLPWPGTPYLTAEKQLEPFQPTLSLIPRGGSREEWRGGYA